MKTKEWLEFFKNHYDTKIFHFNHLKLLSKMENHSLRISLSRLNDRKIIKRICRGYYANPFNPPSLEEISTWIYPPSYISLHSALSAWGILSQIPQVLTCVTTRLPRIFKTSFGTIEYHQIKGVYFWGYIRENNYFIAEKEKALLDFIYMNKKIDIEKNFSELNLSEIDQRKLKSWAEKMNFPFSLISRKILS